MKLKLLIASVITLSISIIVIFIITVLQLSNGDYSGNSNYSAYIQ